MADDAWVEAETCYNEAHVATRAIVERCIGLLKMRFRCLDRSGGALQYNPMISSRIVVVCCALHNLALQRGDLLEEEEDVEADQPGVAGEDDQQEEDEEEEEEEHAEEHQPGTGGLAAQMRHARAAREALITRRFTC